MLEHFFKDENCAFSRVFLFFYYFQTRMGLEININDESARRVDKFLVTNKYKELAENAMSFNRKLNEERKMRIPYVDGQVQINYFSAFLKCGMLHFLRIGFDFWESFKKRAEKL